MKVTATLASMACAVVFAIPANAQTERFLLDSNQSEHLSGCYPPCLCPISIFPGLAGTFDLTSLGLSPSGELWDVTDVEFRVPSIGVAVGSGTYRHLPTALIRHQLELDLSINGNPPTFFDSGVQFGISFPPPIIIDLDVADNGFVCANQVFAILAELTVGEPYCTATPNSTGLPARISATGSVSLANNDLVLRTSPLPSGQPGLFYFGRSPISVAFGNGMRCVGGQTHQLYPIAVAAGGELVHALDVTHLPATIIAPGDTWKFQAWYRDPAAGGSGFDLSDGVSVTFEI